MFFIKDLIPGLIIVQNSTGINIIMSITFCGEESCNLKFWNSEFNKIYTFNYNKLHEFDVL